MANPSRLPIGDKHDAWLLLSAHELSSLVFDLNAFFVSVIAVAALPDSRNI
jgi:hypothetical protein